MIRSKSLAATAVLGLVVVATASGCSSNSSGSGSSASPSANAVALTPEVQAKLLKVIDDPRVQFKAPGLQAGVWTDNGQWVGTSGVAKVGTTQTITPADHSRVGSITKTMTGTVILQLIDEGKLSFDDVIDKYVPGMPNGSIATIKNLIEMQSGIPTYTADTAVVNKYSAAPTTAFTPQELVNSVKKSPPMFAPGARFFYSNTNFVLLGMVIEKVTGKSVSDNFSERLFKPLGMNATSAPGTSTSLPDPYLSGITEQADPLGKIKNATNWNPSFAFTAGEVISTLDDLHKWGVALGTGAGILKDETQKMRLDSVQTTVPPNTSQRSYGMGIVNTAGWFGHTGEIPGYNTVLNYKPDTHTTIVVMVNSDLTQGTGPNQLAPAVVGFEGLAGIMTPGGTASSSTSPS